MQAILQIPIDNQTKRFDILVKQILLYGWESADIIEKIHLRFCI